LSSEKPKQEEKKEKIKTKEKIFFVEERFRAIEHHQE